MRDKKGRFIKGNIPEFSGKHRQNISNSMKGNTNWKFVKNRSKSTLTKQKISLTIKKGYSEGKIKSWNKGIKTGIKSPASFKKGNKPWNKGKKGEYNLIHPDIEARRERARKMGSIKGKTAWNKGKHFLQITGFKNHRWRGGITSENKRIRESLELKLWRKTVFKRDNYTCQVCNKRESQYLEVHHINQFAIYPAERFDLNNGLTVCRGECHRLMNQLSRETEKRTEVVSYADLFN